MFLEVRDLRKDYIDRERGRRISVIDGLNLSVAEGEFLCVIGPSGCGKSTFLNILAGFQQPDSGEVLFKGETVNIPGPDRAMVFQDANLFPWLTAQGNVEFGLRAQGYSAQKRRQIADEFLSVVGLKDFTHSYPFELSGGMRQRVSIARALSLHPDVLLMDEPFGALDSQTRERLQEELLRIWAERRITIIFVTHNVEEAVFLGQRIVVLTPRPAQIRADITLDFAKGLDRMQEHIYTARKAILAELAGTDTEELNRVYTIRPTVCNINIDASISKICCQKQSKES